MLLSMPAVRNARDLRAPLILGVTIWMSLSSVCLADIPLSEADKLRLDAKPWMMKNLEISGYTLPISPITLLILWFSFSFLYAALPKLSSPSSSPTASTAVASHILLPDENKLHQLKTAIGDNPAEFAEMASKYSQCPSAENGGMLGKFKPGTMAPPFERVIFDPDAIVVGTTLGPVQTHFGWHLIYVHERSMAE